MGCVLFKVVDGVLLGLELLMVMCVDGDVVWWEMLEVLLLNVCVVVNVNVNVNVKLMWFEDVYEFLDEMLSGGFSLVYCVWLCVDG